MKSVLEGKSPENSGPKYPCMMLSDKGRVVLFTAYGVGTLVHAAGEAQKDSVGRHDYRWAMDCFEPLKGKVTLSN